MRAAKQYRTSTCQIHFRDDGLALAMSYRLPSTRMRCIKYAQHIRCYRIIQLIRVLHCNAVQQLLLEACKATGVQIEKKARISHIDSSDSSTSVMLTKAGKHSCDVVVITEALDAHTVLQPNPTQPNSTSTYYHLWSLLIVVRCIRSIMFLHRSLQARSIPKRATWLTIPPSSIGHRVAMPLACSSCGMCDAHWHIVGWSASCVTIADCTNLSQAKPDASCCCATSK
jgi:hypothetical protein